MKIIKITAGFLFLTLAFLPLLGFASSDLRVVNYKLNGKEESAGLSPSVAGGKVSIEISANIPVKFNTIALCAIADSVCNRSTAVKYFTKTDAFVSTVIKEWDGKTGKGAVAPNGDYKIKVTMKDEAGIEKIQELTPYVIRIDSPVSNVSSSSEATSSNVSSQSKSESSLSSQPNLDNDPAVKKIRDFIANGGKESSEIATTANNDVVKKASISQNEKTPSNNSRKTSITKFKKDEPKKEEIISTSATQPAEVISSENSNNISFIWRIINLPFTGFNLIKRLFYSGN